jgi:putative ABC transport system permease protein
VARAFGVTLATPGVPLLPALGIVALAVVITVLAVLAPAVSAARVAPLEALRSSSTTGGRKDIGVLRWITGLLLVAGAGLLAAYAIVSLPKPGQENYDPAIVLLTVVGSGALAYFALVSLGPVLVRPVLAAVGWPIRRLGALGRIAVGGVGGAPRRAAAVSVVVALGVTLVAGVVVGGASVRVLAERQSALSSPADYEAIANGDAPISAAMVSQAKASTELTRIAPYRKLTGIKAGSADSTLEATDLRISDVPRLSKVDVQSGSLSALGPGTVVLSSWEEFKPYGVGDTVRLANGRKTVDLKVVARLPGSAPLGASMLLDPSDLTRLGAPATYTGMLADAAHAGETGRTAGRNALRQVTAGAEGIGISVLADQRDQVQRNLDAVLAIAIGLVGLTVLIAVVGVGTTTALSVVERVRESGLLRAVGLSRGGLRVMLTTESALYGVIGAVIGLALGIPYAWLAVKALGNNMPLQLPVGQLAVVFLVLVVFTALAGVLPARRAAKVSPIAALGADV